jgi:hypothetical protein
LSGLLPVTCLLRGTRLPIAGLLHRPRLRLGLGLRLGLRLLVAWPRLPIAGRLRLGRGLRLRLRLRLRLWLPIAGLLRLVLRSLRLCLLLGLWLRRLLPVGIRVHVRVVIVHVDPPFVGVSQRIRYQVAAPPGDTLHCFALFAGKYNGEGKIA